jgi:hypothetical protein
MSMGAKMRGLLALKDEGRLPLVSARKNWSSIYTKSSRIMAIAATSCHARQERSR